MKSQDSIPYYDHHALRIAQFAIKEKNPADLLPFLEELKPNSRVLDLGCGPGIDLLYLSRAGHECVGIEAAPKLVEVARAQNPGLEILEKNFLFFSPKEAEWDGIWANCSLHHFDPEVVQRVVASCFKGLAPGGVFGVVIFEGTESFEDREGDYAGPARFIRPFSEMAMCSMLEQSGFKIKRVGRKPAADLISLPRLLIIAHKLA